ncbi:phage tail protein [Clostridium tyrobutyricum]|uniref:phage tail protein n=1 Tax=Clostridium tyrobutyricum TaxID=1519 RepID=UPI001C3855F6|nr:phage tail protein [Clostridium tyrobutyricum]MBV4427188.1 phage tail protein [Clostridium tyrobutyricum]MBV4440202.1 phage tail protein [Clostridium tyrobutyricum]MBV4442477.1 phage tail protein [Clostridium tyrobutyricum]
MAIAVFGSMIFSVSANKIYSFDDYSFSSSINIEEQEIDNSKSATYIKGLNLDEFSFSISLVKQKTVDIRTEIIKWINLQNKRIPYMFIINNRPITSNKFLLTSVKVESAVFNSKGDYIKAKIEVSFKEYARKGSKKKSAV